MPILEHENETALTRQATHLGFTVSISVKDGVHTAKLKSDAGTVELNASNRPALLAKIEHALK